MSGHGIIRGAKRPDVHGDKRGLVLGSSMVGVTQDTTSGIYAPATAAEWTTTMAAAGLISGNPGALILCQEASGSLADSIGVFTLGALGTGLSYQNAIAGWTRKGLGTTEAGTGRWTSTDASLPDPTLSSYLMLSYINVVSAPASARSLCGYGTAAQSRLEVTLTPRFQTTMTNVATGAADPTGQVRPYVLQHNVTAGVNLGATDAEKLLPVYGNTTTGKTIALGQTAVGSATTRILYSAVFFGAAAELSAAQIKTLLQTLGWTVAWT